MSVQVETPSGKLEGREEAGVRVFRGIPFARPPVGASRYAAPEPAPAWSGVLDAGAFGASAVQNPVLLPLPGIEVGKTDESCLHLNVWTPSDAPGGQGAGRPVLVWIHGGAFVIGSGSQTVYDGAELARRGDAVVVTINYRLGAFGFLYLAELCPGLEGAVANPGMRDQVAALEWVRTHIEAFGGDPGNVTIFGESAGGMSVSTLLGMPSARGLFHKAISQSGACHHFHTHEAATRVAEALLQVLGIDRSEAPRALREMPAAKLIEAQQQVAFGSGGTLGLLPFQPVLDDETLPEPALSAVRGGAASGVPLLVGTTRDEWKLFALLDPEVPKIGEAALLAKLGVRVPEIDAPTLLETYRKARAARDEAHDLPSLFFAVQTDREFRIPAVRLAEAQLEHQPAVFKYRMDWESPAFGGVLGACHAIELPFVFGTHQLPWANQFVGGGAEVDALAGRMMDAWLSFARSGDPGWPAYGADDRTTKVFDGEDVLASDPMDAERVLWEGRL